MIRNFSGVSEFQILKKALQHVKESLKVWNKNTFRKMEAYKKKCGTKSGGWAELEEVEGLFDNQAVQTRLLYI